MLSSLFKEYIICFCVLKRKGKQWRMHCILRNARTDHLNGNCKYLLHLGWTGHLMPLTFWDLKLIAFKVHTLPFYQWIWGFLVKIWNELWVWWFFSESEALSWPRYESLPRWSNSRLILASISAKTVMGQHFATPFKVNWRPKAFSLCKALKANELIQN